jgi:class 3 adenylate cyclase
MFDLFSHPSFNKEFLASLEYGVPVTTEANNDLSFLLDYIQASDGDGNHSKEALRTMVIHPVKEDLRKDSRTVGFLVGIVTWQALFEMGLPAKVNGIDVVVESDCGFVFTYTANGGGPSTTANGDIHDPRYNELGIRYPFLSMDTMSHPEAHHAEGSSELCEFELAIYPTDTFRSSFESTDPSIYSGLIVVVFVCIAAVFFLYDKFTQTRQDEVASQAKRAEAIVTSVFPKGVGMRLIKQAEREQTGRVSDKTMLNNFLAKNGDMGQSTQRSKPIADLFPSTTVMFGDIVGFTAWSSMREPSQVFILLESIYKEFDALAKRRKVFKVETVGDCYVAVCGLPNPRKDHSVVMSRFASDCISRMAVQVQALEVELGPDTADLGIRIGLHSGPVTAGVLRGDRARFQLFGDTVNTCARIESTGWKDKIHLSKETADHLNEMGKGHWYFPRVDKVTAKGKGELETFWLKNIRGNKGSDAVDGGSVVSESFMTSQETSTSVMDVMNSPKIPQSRLSMQGTIQRKMQDLNPKKFDRLVSWNVDVLLTFLTQVEERRQQTGIKADAIERIKTLENEPSGPNTETGTTTLDEVVGVIELPRFDSSCSKPLREKVELGWQVRDQLKEYVTLIASMYNDNPFHNFEHASHVTMSVMKLLSRIVGPDLDNDDARELHDHTYGITSDPLTQFAVVLSALLHDVDHLGVPNTQLVKEAREISQMYNNKSVAEQNSIDLAWSLLMEDRFQVLRRAIYSTEAEFRRFRQLLVNTILATDIMDKDLKSMRNAKWDKAFAESFLGPEEGMVEINNRKATVVIEHLIQASDVAHTMQHWQVYRKWNGRLFKELYRSYSEGHSDKDPSEGWYEGEMGFFDFYILPLAKKLHDCGVFGVASHEYLNYAEQNRREWEAKGKSVVAEFIKEIEAETLARRPKGLSSTGIGASNV